MGWDDAPIATCDVLVFRRVGTRWTHLGGVGRGASWAGTFELPAVADPQLERALTSGRPVRRHGRRPHHVVGPYWAMTSAVVRVDDDHVVVVGSPSADARLLQTSDADLLAAARSAAGEFTAVSPAKHLADELEVLTALRGLTAAAPSTTVELLAHLVECAAQALSCDLAAGWLDDERHAVTAPGWAPRGGAQRAVIAARQLAHALGSEHGAPDWLVVQDAATQPLPAPLAQDQEVASYLAMPLDVAGRRGCLLLVHATGAARGFTALCHSLALHLSDVGSRLLESAVAHDELLRQLDSSRQHAVLDPLTGAANRRGWDEAVVRAREHVASGGAVTVVTVDLDGLKAVNDTHGHAAGDELIVECARALQRCVRGEPDVIARTGGDEFALLVRGHEVAAVEIADRLRLSLESTATAGGLPLRTSVGAATCAPRASLDDAVREADAAMYDDKRARRGGA